MNYSNNYKILKNVKRYTSGIPNPLFIWNTHTRASPEERGEEKDRNSLFDRRGENRFVLYPRQDHALLLLLLRLFFLFFPPTSGIAPSISHRWIH